MINSKSLAQLFDQTDVIVAFLKGPEHRFEYVNAAHIKLLGLDATGKTVREAQPEAEEVYQLLDRVYAGETLRFDHFALPVGKETRYFDFVYSPSFDDQGRVDGVMALVKDITDQVRAVELSRQAQQNLLINDAQFRTALRVTHTGFYDWDMIANKVVFSQQMKNDWGFEANIPLEEVIKFIHPEDQARVIFEINQTITANSPYRIQYRVIRPGDHRVVWIDAQGEVSRDAEGKAVRFFGTSIDITERVLEKQRSDTREQLLGKTQADLLLALDSAKMGTWHIDLESEVVTTSEGFAKLFGVEEVQGNIFEEISRYMHPDDVEEVNRVWTAAVSELKPYSHEYRIVWPDGSIHWVYSRGNVTLDHLGKPFSLSGVLSDVTERVLARKLIEASEQDIRRIANAMPQIVWTAQPDGVLDYTNERGVEFTGSSEPGGWLQFVHPDDVAITVQTWTNCVLTGADYEIEFRLRNTSGEYRWFLTRAQPSRNSDGKIERWIGTCTDVQDQKNAANARDEFISIASHELRTPLTSLILQTQMMQRNYDKGKVEAFSIEKVGTLLGSTEKQVGKLNRLVNDMLDFSQISSGKLSITRVYGDLSAVLKEVFDRLKDQVNERGSELTITKADSAPGEFDAFRMEQVITNLITNASRYGEQKPIELSLSVHGNRARISVKDHGRGIAKENLSRIFNRFERAVSANEVSGLGLGLFISNQIVEAHHGKITVESELGKGSTFTVEIPLR